MAVVLAMALGLVCPTGWMGDCCAQAQEASDAPAREFPPGVLTTIPPDVRAEEAISVHDVVELRANKKLDRDPHSTSKSRTLYGMAKDAYFNRPTWCLELTFKPLRMMEVDIPQPSGKMQRKLIWYMVYRVRNTGAGLVPKKLPDGTFTTEPGSTDKVRFIPQFVLSTHDRDRQGEPIRKAYLDRIIPAALQPITRRELPGGHLLNSVEMAERLLAVENDRSSRGVWGLVTWEDVDPEIDFFSVYVGGLSNAIQWSDPPEAYKPGNPPGTGRKFLQKKLQLNFWRPGDAVAENEREIRFGIPPGKADFYDCNEGVAYRWLYR